MQLHLLERKAHTQKGFTLVELLVAISILSAIALASYKILSDNTLAINTFSKHADYQIKLQQFSLIIDRDFSQISQHNNITLSENTIEFESIQNDSIMHIRYAFDEDITRYSSRKRINNTNTEEFEQVLITTIENPSVKILTSKTTNLVANWDKKKGGYPKALEIKFTHPEYGELTKLVLITE